MKAWVNHVKATATLTAVIAAIIGVAIYPVTIAIMVSIVAMTFLMAILAWAYNSIYFWYCGHDDTTTGYHKDWDMF